MSFLYHLNICNEAGEASVFSGCILNQFQIKILCKQLLIVEVARLVQISQNSNSMTDLPANPCQCEVHPLQNQFPSLTRGLFVEASSVPWATLGS